MLNSRGLILERQLHLFREFPLSRHQLRLRLIRTVNRGNRCHSWQSAQHTVATTFVEKRNIMINLKFVMPTLRVNKVWKFASTPNETVAKAQTHPTDAQH